MKKIVIVFLGLSGMLFSQPLENSNMIVKNKSYSKSSNKKQSVSTTKKMCQKNVDTRPCCSKCPVGLSFAFKAGYFWPQEKIYRRIYGGGLMPLFEMCYDIGCCRAFGLFGEVGYFYKSTDVRSEDVKVDTNVTTIPLSIGLSYTFKALSWIDVYFKIGPNYIYTKTWVDIEALKRHIHKNTFGGTFGTGLKFNLCNGAFLEMYANYLYDRKKIHDFVSGLKFKRYLGGIQTGVGLGYKF